MPRVMRANRGRMVALIAARTPLAEMAKELGYSEPTSLYAVARKLGLEIILPARVSKRRPLVKSQAQRRDAHERRTEALIASGEIDRRVIAYRMFSMGATTAAVMAATGGTEEETLRFKRELPTNWLILKD